MENNYFLYKGIKKPLVFFGLKGKYIYYSLGILVISFVLIGIFSSITGFVGILIGLIICGILLWLIFKIQDKNGLFNKTKNKNELHIIPKMFKNKILINEKEGI